MRPTNCENRIDKFLGRASDYGTQHAALECTYMTLERIERGDLDPSFVITHTVGLDQGPEMYNVFRNKQDSCIKVVLKPGFDEVSS